MTNPIQQPADPFADEIDLRDYVRILLRRWPWIVAPALIAGLVAAGISFLVLSPVYQATALAAITPPRYLMQFSPEFRTVEQERIQALIYSNLPQLAKSDELVQRVRDSLQTEGGEPDRTLSRLRGQMEVEGSRELGFIYLRVEDTDPRLAAQIVNAWANLYVQELNALYGAQGTEYEFFVEQLDLAKGDVLTAQEALAEFKARDPSSLLSSELAAQLAALDSYLAWRTEIELRLQQLGEWLTELAAQPAQQTALPSDEVAAFLMQLEVLGLGSAEGQSQFQIPLEQLAQGHSVADQVAKLESLQNMLEAHLVAIETRITEAEPEVLQLQKALQEAENEQARLTQALDITRSLYQSLSLKAEEARIAVESQAGVATLASRAAVPEKPVGPRKLINTALGTMLGLAAGLALVVVLELFQDPPSTAGAEA